MVSIENTGWLHKRMYQQEDFSLPLAETLKLEIIRISSFIDTIARRVNIFSTWLTVRDKACWTVYRNYNEYLHHPVFRAARAVAMRRSPTCGCGDRASEVHHADKYPPWGMFDVPSNLTPICHKCHCLEHGKNE